MKMVLWVFLKNTAADSINLLLSKHLNTASTWDCVLEMITSGM